MNRNLLIGIIVVAVLVVGAAMLLKTSPSSQNVTDTQTQVTVIPTEAITEDPSSTGSAEATEVKEFTVSGSPFKYDIKEIKVKKGDKVKITFKSTAGTHDFVIDEFDGAKTAVLNPGEEEVVEFTADEAGSFEYYCSVGNHRAMGMKGKLIVE
ncbi:MAG: plastocyanin/azurin family copper-binding protein [Patescibacteria group bacterium]